MCVAWCLGVTFRLSRSQRCVSLASNSMRTHSLLCRSFAIAASMFMNLNSLPVALMQSLVVTVHGLKWTPDDNKNAMIGRALTYLVLYSTFGMIVSFSNSFWFFSLPYCSSVGPTESNYLHKLTIPRIHQFGFRTMETRKVKDVYATSKRCYLRPQHRPW